MAAKTHWWDAPVRGEFPALPPDQIPERGARSLRNFLVHLPGKVIPRGSIGGPDTIQTSNVQSVNDAPLAGHYVSPDGDSFVVSFFAAEATAKSDPWRCPINRPAAAADVSSPLVGNQTAVNYNFRTGAVTGASSAQEIELHGYRSAAIDRRVYWISLGGPDFDVGGYFAPRTQINMTGVGTAAALSTGPHYCQDIAVHFGRLFVAASQPPGQAGAAAYDPSLLFYSIEGGTTAGLDQISDWQNPISGLVNTIGVGDANADDFIVALGRAGGNLVIFKRRSVWLLYGTSPEDFTLRQLRTQHGCVDARSVAIVDEGVFFASQAGYEFFDGTRFRLVSGPVSDTWLEFSNRGPAASTVNTSYIISQYLPNEYVHITLGTRPLTVGADGGAERNWLYHIPSGAWVDLTCAITSLGLGGTGAFDRCVLGGLVSGPGIALLGNGPLVRADRLTYGPQDAVGVVDQDLTTAHDVDLRWVTGLHDAGARWEAARMLKISGDYFHQWSSEVPPNEDPMGTFSVGDGSGSTIAVPGALPGYRPSLAPLRRRPVVDSHHELNRGDVELDIRSDIGADPALRTGRFEVYGAGVEYERGRGRRL